jgi:hypothetical protein
MKTIRELVNILVEVREIIDQLDLTDDDRKRLREIVNRGVKRLALKSIGF